MRLDARTWILFSIYLTGISILTNLLVVQASIFLLTLLLYFWKTQFSVPITNIKKFRHLLVFLLSVSLLQILFRHNGEVLFRIASFTITEEGVHYAEISMLRYCILLSMGLILTSIPYTKMLYALTCWKIPYELSFLIATTIHYVEVLWIRINKLKETLTLRAFTFKELSARQRLSILQELLIPLLAVVLKEMNYRVISLEMRAFRLHKNRTLLNEEKLPIRDLLLQLVGLVIFLVVLSIEFA